jgi:SulP family sulfate permease
VYFAAAPYVAEQLRALRAAPHAPRHLLVAARSMNFIDQAGIEVWEDELRQRRAAGGDLYFHRPRSRVEQDWRRAGFLSRLGEDHVFPSKAAAIRAIYQRLDQNICAQCQARCFLECGATRASADPASCG